MSGAAGLPAVADDLVLDPGVLGPQPAIEFNGLSAAGRTAGVAVLPWRAHAREAQAAGIAYQPHAAGLTGFAQAVVRVGKGRAATTADLAAAWAALLPGGRLLLAGGNDVGIASWAKRLARDLGQPGTVLANRAHGRVVAFTRTDAVLEQPAPTVVPLPDGTPLAVAPGVFSGDGLDRGTALLLAVLAEEPPAALVGDIGCGAGHLGLAAACRWPAARVLLLDADHRAVACAAANADAVAPGRATATWWDEADAWPAAWPALDLALLNPPWHAGTATDFSTARRLCAAPPARRLLLVANRRLPYEGWLREQGTVRERAVDDGFKVLELTR